MYILFLYGFFIVMSGIIIYKSSQGKSEWMLLLFIMSYIKTLINYLFAGSTVFTLVTVGSIQIHLDDVILVTMILFVLKNFFTLNIKANGTTAAMLLIVIPIGWSLLRGVTIGSISFSRFLSDTRSFIVFLMAILSTFIIFEREKNWKRIEKWKLYLNRLMNVVLVYILIVWMLDLVFGLNSLPGQYNGTLSDGGSTLRIINPPQVLMIAMYTLYIIYLDIRKKNMISLRSMLFALIVILMQWRTVVAAFAVALIVEFIYLLKKGKINKQTITQMSFLTIAGVVALFCSGGRRITQMLGKFFNSFLNVFANKGTFSTRKGAWQMLLDSLEGVDKWLGQPFGSERAASVTWTHSAHNGYVDYIMLTGYIGVALLLFFMAYIIAMAIKEKKVVIAFICIAQLIYWYGYGFSVEQGALIGMFLAMFNRKRQAELYCHISTNGVQSI